MIHTQCGTMFVQCLVYDQNFYGGRGVDGEDSGGSSERCLKWDGGGSLRDLSKNILKQGVRKGKVVRRGRMVLKVSPLLPSRKC